MNSQVGKTQISGERTGFFNAIWKHRLWWMLPLGVLLLLLAAIYALEHLSKTDSEMYPTSSQVVMVLSSHMS